MAKAFHLEGLLLFRNLYDSHVHLMATGQVRCEWDLGGLKGPEDLRAFPRDARYRRGEWFVGFGWDENKWTPRATPHRRDLDAIFPDNPVCLSRADGHSAWVNTRALELFGYDVRRSSNEPEVAGGEVRRDANGEAIGILTENAFYSRVNRIPAPSNDQMRDFLTEGVRRFNEAGFTHARDMGSDIGQWKIARDLEESGRWNLHVGWNFVCENLEDFERALKQAKEARGGESALNRVAGIKFYMDGSLGSDTARLSKPYAHRTDGAQGLLCWAEADAKEVIRRSWSEGFDVAVHTIGDEAADKIVRLARDVSASGVSGRVHLEHAEVLRNETIQLMKAIHVSCHIQPCHFLSDRRWLKEKLGTLFPSAFPWEALRRMGIPFHFGSDSPIEPPSIADNLRALRESAEIGIPALKADPMVYHVHPSPSAQGTTRLENDRVREVRLQDRLVFES